MALVTRRFRRHLCTFFFCLLQSLKLLLL